MELYRQGKVKNVYIVDDSTFEFEFTDNISVFDKIIPSSIPDKGEILCKTSEYWFKVLRSMGIKHHYLSSPSLNKMRVRRVDIIESNDLKEDSANFLVPLEVICRHYIAGSFHERLKKNPDLAREYGLDPDNIKYGSKLPKPIVEFTTKLEPVDRLLDEKEAMEISKCTQEELDRMKEIVLKIDQRMGLEVGKRGLIHVDGKKEFAMDADRELMVVDTFGTSDEDRFWDMEAYKGDGSTVELSKEAVRKHYKDSGYYDELKAARASGVSKDQEPPIPALPRDVVDEVRDLYVTMYERLTGHSWGEWDDWDGTDDDEDDL